MEIRERVAALRSQAFLRIEEAARNGETEEVIRLGRIPKECEDAMLQLQNLETRIERIELELVPTEHGQQLSAPVAAKEASARPVENGNMVSSNGESGDELRAAYAKALGLKPQRGSKTVYLSSSRQQVGVPYATELARLPNRWWLGLPDQRFYSIVLLCLTDSGILDFVLPSDFVAGIWQFLSRDTRGQVKINVFKVGDDYELRLKGRDPESIERFLGGPLI